MGPHGTDLQPENPEIPSWMVTSRTMTHAPWKKIHDVERNSIIQAEFRNLACKIADSMQSLFNVSVLFYWD